jgi:hypothetical protein
MGLHRKNSLYIRFLLITFFAVWALSGCVPKVQIPAVQQFNTIVGQQEGVVDVDAHGELLLGHLYQLLKANEGVEVPLCTAEKDTRKCIKDGVGVFVFGGGIPGMGTRSCYVFSDISIGENELVFTKDNRKTRFIGTPMFVRKNQGHVSVKDGGLQVQMDNYYANWAGVGNMTMAEGWAIDFMDFDRGIVGLQLELDIKGVFVSGGGSNYVLLRFPTVPEILHYSGTPIRY